MGIIKDRFKAKSDAAFAEIKDLLKEHGTKKIGEVQLSQIDTSVQYMFLQNNARFAKVDIHEALFDPKTRQIIGAERVFIGEIDGDPT